MEGLHVGTAGRAMEGLHIGTAAGRFGGRYRSTRMKNHFAVLLALGVLVAAPALAAAPRASLPDIEDEVMCPTCGVALNQAFSPQAERERNFIRAQIARGRTKAEIKDELVSEFGPRV